MFKAFIGTAILSLFISGLNIFAHYWEYGLGYKFTKDYYHGAVIHFFMFAGIVFCCLLPFTGTITGIGEYIHGR